MTAPNGKAGRRHSLQGINLVRAAVFVLGVVFVAATLLGCNATVGPGGGPGGPGAAAQGAAWPRGSCVGVASTISDTFTVKTVGITVFGNEEKKTSIASWGIDELIISSVARHIGPQVTAKRAGLSKEALRSLKQNWRDIYDEESALRARMREYSPAEPCARYVIVDRFEVDYDGTNQVVGGLGIARRLAVGRPFHLHTIFALRLYDGQTLGFLRGQVGTLDKVKSLELPAPHVRVDPAAWPNPGEDPAARAMFRLETRKLLTEVLDISLPKLRILEGRPGGV